MTDLSRVKANVQLMVEQGAPESDIDRYLFSEKVTPAQLRADDADPIKQTVRGEIGADRAKGVPSASPIQRRLLQGMTFNTADEILAGLNTPIEMFKRGTLNPIEAYNYAKAREDLELEDARKDTGLGGAVAEIGGGVMSGAGLANAGLTAARMLPQGAGLLRRMGASALDGLGFGALAGAGEGNSLSERGMNALQGGAIGGAVGGVAPAAITAGATALSPIISNIRARVNPESFARSQVARGVVESGQTPDEIALAVSQAANDGQGMFSVADAMGNAGQRLLATTARSPGRARTDVLDFLDNRQAGQGRRIAGALAEGFEAPQTAAQTEARLTRARGAAADAEFSAVRSDAGPVDLSPVIARIDETLTPGRGVFSNNTNIANDSIESALDSIRRRLTDGQSNLTDFTAIQRVRGDLSDMVESARRAGQGNRARMLGQVLREMDGAMENASPGFRQANANFAQASRNIDAIDAGRTAATRGRTEDTIPVFRALTPEGQAAFRSGYADPLIGQAQGAAFGSNKARPLINDAFADESLAMAPGSPLMNRRIGREDTMFQTRNAASGNSKTVENTNDDAAMGALPGLIGNVMSGNMSGALRAAMSAVSNGWNGNTAGVREEVARILMQRGQNVNPMSIQAMLDETVRRIEALSNIARQLGRGGSAGLAVAPSATGNRR